MKHRIICNILLAALFVYKAYILDLNYFFTLNISDKSFGEILLILSFTILPLLAVLTAFIANCIKHPFDITIISISVIMCVMSFLAEGFIWIVELVACCEHNIKSPWINILVVIIAAVSAFCSTKEYEKNKDLRL